MRPFNLEEYLANPSRKVVTREGRDVRIICTDRKGDCPIVALIKKYDGDSEVVAAYSKNGVTNEYAHTLYDLFFAHEKKEGWINIYKNIVNNRLPSIMVFNTKEEAIKSIFNQDCYIDTIKIEWEE